MKVRKLFSFLYFLLLFWYFWCFFPLQFVICLHFHILFCVFNRNIIIVTADKLSLINQLLILSIDGSLNQFDCGNFINFITENWFYSIIEYWIYHFWKLKGYSIYTISFSLSKSDSINNLKESIEKNERGRQRTKLMFWCQWRSKNQSI